MRKEDWNKKKRKSINKSISRQERINKGKDIHKIKTQFAVLFSQNLKEMIHFQC